MRSFVNHRRRSLAQARWVLLIGVMLVAVACGNDATDAPVSSADTSTTPTETAATGEEPESGESEDAPSLGSPIIVGSRGGSIGEAERSLLWDPFTAETGVEVVQFEGPDTDAIVSAQCETGNVEMGLTITTDSGYASLLEQGCLMEIDYSQFPEQSREVVESMSDLAVKSHGIASSTIGVNLAYSTEAFAEGSEPQTWEDFWDVENFPGGRAMPSFPFFTMEIALLADGVASEDLYPIDVDRALAKLEEIRPHVVNWWSAGAAAPQLLIDGEATVAVAYNGRIEIAQSEGAPLGYSWDQALTYHDYAIIPAGAPNAESHLAALAFMYRPDVAADLASATYYPIPSTLVWEAAPEDVRQSWPNHPENIDLLAVMDFLWWAEDAGDGSGLTNEEALQERMNAFLGG